MQVPRLARLSLINCTISDSEEKCFNNLIPSISRKKNFRNLIVSLGNLNKQKMYDIMDKFMNINNMLNAQLLVLKNQATYDSDDYL